MSIDVQLDPRVVPLAVLLGVCLINMVLAWSLHIIEEEDDADDHR